MNALAASFISSRTPSRNRSQLRVSVTNSGFSIVSVPSSKYDTARIAELAFKMAGVFLIPVGGVVLFLQSLFAPQMVEDRLFWIGQIGLLAAFVFIGVALHRWANKGFRRRVQVDAVREEVRIGTVNVAGDVTISTTVPASRIESFFIIRSSTRGTPARLKMRLKSGAAAVTVAEGDEATLVPILERITLSLRPPRMRNRRIRTKTTGRFIRMSFG